MSLAVKLLMSALAVGGIALGQKEVIDRTSDGGGHRTVAAPARAEPATYVASTASTPVATITSTVAPEVPLPPFDPASGVYGLMPLATKDPLSYGATGDTVAYMQAVLRFSAGQDLEIDGIFGPDTANAVHNLETFWGLPIDGTIQDDDWGVIDFLASS